MGENRDCRRNQVSSELHPLVYGAIIGLCLWLIISFWGFFGKGYTRLVLLVASLFIAVAVAIPILLWRISGWARDRAANSAEPSRFADWLAHDFEAWPGRQRGLDAAVEVLLPIAAVAFGMSGFALALHLAVG